MNKETKERIRVGIGCVLVYGLGILATIKNQCPNDPKHLVL